MAIPSEKIEEVRAKANIVEVVSEFVNLKRSGRGYTGLCPFHAEKTPSFHVDEEKQLYHCFGCGKGGTIFDFIEEMKGLTFPETVRLLASRYGVTIEETERRPEQDQSAKLRRALVETMREAEKLFGEILRAAPGTPHGRSGSIGREYLESRGITADLSDRFRLGYAPQRWDLITGELVGRLKKDGSGLPLEEEKILRLLVSAGLIKRRQADSVQNGEAENSKGYYDFFRERLVFPITRSDGVTVAFSARALRSGEGIPKYLNTPETPLFSKRRTFFGLSQALPAIRKGRHLYLVEGNIDVISMVQAGLDATVATCGTAVTPEHVAILKRLVSRITVIFDGDSAGRKAAASCFELFRNSGVDLEAVALEPGVDPDSLCRSGGSREAILAAMQAASRPLVVSFIEYCLAESGAAPGTEPSGTILGNAAVRFVRALAGIENPVEREALLKAGAERLGTTEQALSSLLSKEVNKSGAGGGQAKSQGRSDNWREPGDSFTGLKGQPQNPASTGARQQSQSYQAGSPTSGRWRGVSGRPNRPDAEPVAGREKSGPAAAKNDLRGRFLQQIIVSIIREPGIARSISELDTFREAGVLNAESERLIKAVVKRVEGAAAMFDDDGDQSPLVGLSVKFTDPLEQERMVSIWRGLLTESGMEPAKYIDEALSQTRIGGAEPEGVWAKLSAATSHYSLRDQVEELKERELEADDAEGKLKLIQEKLLKRRSIERLKR